MFYSAVSIDKERTWIREYRIPTTTKNTTDLLLTLFGIVFTILCVALDPVDTGTQEHLIYVITYLLF